MNNPWLSLLPPLLAIAAAIWSKKIIPSLLFGLLVGSFLLKPTLIGGFENAIEKFINTLADKDNLKVLVFLYLFSGMITLMKRAGGIKAFSDFASKYIKNERGVFYSLWALIPVTFIDCAFRIVGAGSIMRSLSEKYKIKKERFAFMLNNTASPVIELVPIATTFVGFNIANIGQGLKVAGVSDQHSAYSVLLNAIPFEFFSLVVIVITFISIFTKWTPFSMSVRSGQPVHEHSGAMKMPDASKSEDPEIKPRIINLVVPMLAVIFFSIFFFWYFGKTQSDAGAGLAELIAATDPNKAMLLALFISLILTSALYFLQKYPVRKMAAEIISGGNEVMNIIAILVLAWSLGSVSQELNLSVFIQQTIGNTLPGWGIPVSIFLLSSAVTYFIGAGWAAASLIMPLAISLAVTTGIGIPICVGAVITGGTFGDVTSPVAGMTNMASGVAQADQIKYLEYASPYNFTALGIAALLFLLFGYVGS